MELFNQGMTLIASGVAAYGSFWLVWGVIILAGGIKDKTAPEIKQGIGQIVGGVLIILAAAMILQIKIGS